MHELASLSLELVNRELANTLETARGEIEDYVDGQSDAEALVRAASMLHLAAGALKIVQIHGAALLAEEMELTCRAIHEQGSDKVEGGVEALTRAMVQLPAYLDRLMSGGADIALVLLPLLNDLRTARGQPMLSEGTLVLLHTGPFERFRASPEKPPVQQFSSKVPALAQKLRPKFQSALLKWIRGDNTAAHLKELIAASDALEAAAESEPVRQLWAVTGGVLVGLQSGALSPTMQIKRLLGQADRQLKRLIDSGEQAFVSVPPVDLLNSFLYYVARAPGDNPRLAKLRDDFGVETVIPDAAEVAQAREDLAGPSVKLMRTVAEAIKEDLGQVKDALDIFVRTGMSGIESLKPQLDMLKKIGDTLGVLGLEPARKKIQTEFGALAKILEAETVDDPAPLERIAASLLGIEDMLDHELVRAGGREAEEARPTDGSTTSANQFRHVTQAVMRECIVNLAKIKDVVIKVLDKPDSLSSLDQIEPQLRGIVAGLLMLNKTRAVNVIERIGRNITTRLGPGAAALRPNLVERLADAIVSIEYYMETIALGRTDPFYMLDNASRCLDLVEGNLGGAPGAAPGDEEEPAEVEEIVLSSEVPMDEDEDEDEDDSLRLSVMDVDADRSEPELVEVFIEEAKDELAKIREQLPRWLDRNEDSEALIAARRSFHTLKGSGRVVGAQLLGEYAWSIENLLNRIINQTLKPDAEMLSFIGEAAGALPALIEQLEIGIRPAQDINALIARAHRLAEGREEPDTDATAMHRMPTMAAEEATSGEGAGEPTMDPVLRGIFVKEVREHLQTIRDFVAQAAGQTPPVAVTEPLHRALHTLFGSARMAACGPAIDLVEPLERKIRKAFETGRLLAGEAVTVIGQFADEIESLSAALEAGAPLAADRGIVTAIHGIELVDVAGVDDTRQTRLPEFDDADTLAEPDLGPESELVLELEPEPELVLESESAPEPEPEVEPELGADFDPEIAAIFCDEASELLDAAETQLAALKRSTSAPAALDELKRLLHTLKGGARLAGVTAMGDLSHALETMLPKLAAASADADSAGMQLAQQTLDRLQQMRDAVDAGHGVAAAGALVQQLERFGATPPAKSAAPTTATPAAASSPQPAPAGKPAVPAKPAAAPDVSDTRAQPKILAPGTKAEPDVPRVAASAPGDATEPAGADLEAAAELDAAAQVEAEVDTGASARHRVMDQTVAVTGGRADMARVDAGLLDELLNGAGEISIFQSRLNQQVHSIEFHLGELGQTVTRLREQLRSLEAETEAQILHRHQGDVDEDERFDPLELDRYSTIQQLSRALAETSNDVASINELLQGLTSEADTLLTQQSRVTTQLQDGLMQTRMVSFDRQATRLGRIVRQAAQDTRKQAELVIEGAQSQLDRQILEAIVPALEHLLRNAVVHGIESTAARSAAGKPATGRVLLSVRREGAEVLIEVGDDGAGLDVKAIRRKASEKGLIRDGETIGDDDVIEMILLPGFSTADELTQAAGRGVGMDVVDNEIKRLGGSLRISTEPGKGTRFLIRLPYTLAITHALIVNVGDETFALPLPTVEGIARVRREELLGLLTEDDPRLAHGDSSYRVQHLGSLVGSAPSALPEDESAVSLVLVRAGDSSSALLTDSLEGSREIVVKTLGPHIASVPGVSGATILGDGRVVVILDVGTLVRAQQGDAGKRGPSGAAKDTRPLSALVVDDSITMRRVTQRLLERRGVRVYTARDGLDAIDVLRENEVDIILLDIEMPRMDGYQFATHVRNDARLKDLPIIMVTSRSGEKHRARAIEIGVNDYLSKPYQEAELVAAIGALVGRKL